MFYWSRASSQRNEYRIKHCFLKLVKCVVLLCQSFDQLTLLAELNNNNMLDNGKVEALLELSLSRSYGFTINISGSDSSLLLFLPTTETIWRRYMTVILKQLREQLVRHSQGAARCKCAFCTLLHHALLSNPVFFVCKLQRHIYQERNKLFQKFKKEYSYFLKLLLFPFKS